jgi:hypothetical protein
MRPCNLLGATALLTALFGLPAVSTAAADEGPGDCLGVDFDVAHPIVVVRILPGKPRVYFVKSTMDDAACPAATDACRSKAYLIPGDLALIGKTYGAYTCVAYESAQSRKVQWTNGWLPSASLGPVKPAPSPHRSDWIGAWVRASGHIDITMGDKGSLDIQGEAFYAAAQNVHTGVIDATAKPVAGLLQFADDGSVAFNDPNAECLVRMQRVESLLVVEDNNSCGGIMVTFTGFYRRKN